MIGLFCLLALALIVFLGVILVGAIYRWCAGRGPCRLADRGDPPWAAGERRREVDPPVLERSLEDEIGRLLEDAGVEDDLHAHERVMDRSEQLRALASRQQRAVDLEQYEEAGAIQKKIAQLRAESGGSHSQAR